MMMQCAALVVGIGCAVIVRVLSTAAIRAVSVVNVDMMVGDTIGKIVSNVLLVRQHVLKMYTI